MSIHPALLGGGKPLFRPTGQRAKLRLVEARTFDSQVVLMRHELVEEN